MALNLYARLTGDNSGFKSMLSQSEGMASQVGGRIASSLSGRIATAFSGAALVGYVHQILEYASVINDLKERLEVSAESAQQFFSAAKRGGQDVNAVAQAMQRMEKSVEIAMGDDKKAIKMRENFEKFGLSMKEIELNTPEQTFRKLFDVMAQGGMSTEQMAAGFEILSRTFGRLIPVAKEMEAAKTAIRFTDEDLAGLDKIGDELGSFWNKLKVIGGAGLLGLKSLPQVVGDMFTAGVSGDVTMGDLMQKPGKLSFADRLRAVLDGRPDPALANDPQEIKRRANEEARKEREKEEAEARHESGAEITRARVKQMEKEWKDQEEDLAKKEKQKQTQFQAEEIKQLRQDRGVGGIGELTGGGFLGTRVDAAQARTLDQLEAIKKQLIEINNKTRPASAELEFP